MTDKKCSSFNFTWDTIGDIAEGRKNIGQEMPVSVYRLFQYTMRDVIADKYGKEECIALFRECGRLAGKEFCKNTLDVSLPLGEFTAQLQKTMAELKIGILRFEHFDEKTGKATLTVGEDLDCSGIPVTGETVCNYDEGFIAGILSEYTKEKYIATEIDCWAKGDRVCRFNAEIQE